VPRRFFRARSGACSIGRSPQAPASGFRRFRRGCGSNEVLAPQEVVSEQEEEYRGDCGWRVLERQRDDALVLFSSLSEEKSLERYAAGKWSIRQVANHVTDCERVFLFRAFWFARIR
jgi:DinB superfamily